MPKHATPSQRINQESAKEKRALEALACIGVIGGLQLSRLFSLDKKRKKKMTAEKKLVRHNMKKNNRVIPVYTLGVNGAAVAGVPGYQNNYWLKYKVEEVLKRLLFFQLYEYFPDSRIFPASEPFVGSVFVQNNPIYIYVLKGDIQDLMMYLKWKAFDGRIIIITESLSYLHLLELWEDLKVRAVLEHELRNSRIEEIFYIRSLEGIWRKEKVVSLP
ncbi:hypothetical protein L2D08_23115 [Domibacillus sp. PGB-M46]|uniref:hypothetical protein n=1 Tax=Domibacillus sp. PGB-M46 TaxID=2910255 RepID=UPI001F56F580|nr:hypothetical protein [Domibacillus sp. PGB-M46]MCI2257206.1 hypothetical protein [Domibacillus sp. PGB-M46]